MFTNAALREIYDKTDGHCHFCGDEVVLEKYGLKNINDVEGVWEADHVRQRGKGGNKESSNCLPACYRCNRLRWHRKGEELRELIFLGLIARGELKRDSVFGRKLRELKEIREEQNEKRRRSQL